MWLYYHNYVNYLVNFTSVMLFDASALPKSQRPGLASLVVERPRLDIEQFHTVIRP